MEYCRLKKCKSCIKEIEATATKCPFCQSHQNWYKNPQYLNLIFMLPFFIFIYWNTGVFNKKEFEEYKTEFVIKEENTVSIENSRSRLITFRIKNNTKHKWGRINYEVIGYENDKVIAVNTGAEFNWVVQPNSNALLTVKVKYMPSATSWKFNITDLKSDRF